MWFVANQLQAENNLKKNELQQQVYYLNIPRSDAASALNKLAQQTDSVLIYSFQQVQQHQANALHGYFSLADALHYILLGGGLSAEFISPDVIKISAIQHQKNNPDSAQTTQSTQTPHNTAQQTNIAEVIRVDGIRHSLDKALDIKQNANTIVDVIVAEDIGKLPDNTAVESLARLPGIQVTRYKDEADGLVIRGLPYYTTTYNGREIFTAELRRVQLQDFPSQSLSAIEVYKQGTAKLLESGVGGLINAVTRKPFDFASSKFAGAIQLGYNDQTERAAPIANLLISSRWQNQWGEFGGLVNANFARSYYYNGIKYTGTYYPEASEHWQISPAENQHIDFFMPVNVGLYNEGGKRSRPLMNFALQWKPSEGFEYYLEGIYQGFRAKAYKDQFDINLAHWDASLPPIQINDLQLFDSHLELKQAKSFSKQGGLSPFGYRLANKEQTNTNQIAMGAIWQGNAVRLQTDLAYTNSDYNNAIWSLDFILDKPQRVDVEFNTPEGVRIKLPDFQPFEAEQYLWRGYFERMDVAAGSGIQWRTDATYFTSFDYFHRIDMGWRYAKRDASSKFGWRYFNTQYLAQPLNKLAFIEYEKTLNPFRNDTGGLNQYLAPTRESIADNHETLRLMTLTAIEDLIEQHPEQDDLYPAQQAFSNAEIPINPDSDYSANETRYAFYLQADYEIPIGAFMMDGGIGVRVLNVHSDVFGISTIRDALASRTQQAFVNHNQMYYLPSFNMRIKYSDALQLRLGYAKTMNRQGFALLNPAMNISLLSSDTPAIHQDGSINARAYGGNPNIKALTSKNYDLSLEYYYGFSSYLSGALFYRDLNGFAHWLHSVIDDPEYGQVEIFRPENAQHGRIYGYEVNWQTFLDFIPVIGQNVGLSCNLTYLQGQSNKRNEQGEFTELSEFPGLSKWTYNTVLFYEADKFSIRLSYNYRSSWINLHTGLSESGGFTGRKTRARDRLDVSASYQLNKQYAVFAEISNLIARPFRNYNQLNDTQYYNIDLRDEGRYFNLGMRFNF
ncbi:TonB-dependent receptor [Catenovulum sediminis]|uniref:TonB-dependent receptor n=1 Tax=Catenovulum sediminis TaxID=1740262 RepID=A0ABV1RBT4_9ALTE